MEVGLERMHSAGEPISQASDAMILLLERLSRVSMTGSIPMVCQERCLFA
jgi:hypothetical protein